MIFENREPQKQNAVPEENGGPANGGAERLEDFPESEKPSDHRRMIEIAEVEMLGPNPIVRFVGGERNHRRKREFDGEREKDDGEEPSFSGLSR